MIVRDVAAKQQEQYGATAEQIVTKVENDPSALGIAQHLLKDAQEREIERLLLKVLPARYFAELDEEFPNAAKLDGHSRLFRSAFDIASESTNRKVMARYVSVLKEEPGPSVDVYEEKFFRALDLEYLEEDERDLVKTHLLSRLREPTLGLIEATRGIGESG